MFASADFKYSLSSFSLAPNVILRSRLVGLMGLPLCAVVSMFELTQKSAHTHSRRKNLDLSGRLCFFPLVCSISPFLISYLMVLLRVVIDMSVVCFTFKNSVVKYDSATSVDHNLFSLGIDHIWAFLITQQS